MTQSENIIIKLRNIKPELQSRFFVQTIGLFGSVVRDDYVDKTSDIDVIVDFSRPVGVEFIDLAEFLENHIERKIDLVSLKGIKEKYYQAIRKEIIYV